MTGRYFLDNKDLYTQYGVFIKKSSGLLDFLKMKKNYSYSWPDEHGDDIDLSKLYFESKKISLECYLEAPNQSTFTTRLQNFFAALTSANLHTLKAYGIAKVFMVYLEDASEVVRLSKWSNNKMMAQFTLKLVCPVPVSRQFTTNQNPLAQVTVNVTTSKNLEIYWGDGTKTAVTSSGAKTHNYSVTGTYYIVLAGDISAISALTLTNCTEI